MEMDTKICKGSVNFVQHLDGFYWGPSRNRLSHLAQARRAALKSNLSLYDTGQVIAKFNRRITALSWHPKQPYLVAAASKAGDVNIARRYSNDLEKRYFMTNTIIDGEGPGGAVFSVKFNPEDPNKLYTASLSGRVRGYDLCNIDKEADVFHDFSNWSLWHTAMDVCLSTGLIMACDNKGYARLFDIRTCYQVKELRLHKSKIHHCEFNPTVPHVIATAALDPLAGVGIWDLRQLGKEKQEAVKQISGIKAANVSTFNPSGTRLLVNDQKDVIKAYSGPLWDEYLSIKHPHRQFQHLTGIEASWHPVEDLIVIGRYPVEPPGTKPPAVRPVDIFDGNNGDLLASLTHPINGIISLNHFSPNGEVLASGMGANFVIWQASHHLAMLSEGKNGKTSQVNKNVPASMRNAIRGLGGGANRSNKRGANRNAGASSDDEEDEIDQIKKKKKAAAAKRSRKKAAADPVYKPEASSEVTQEVKASGRKTKGRATASNSDSQPSSSTASTSRAARSKTTKESKLDDDDEQDFQDDQQKNKRRRR